MILVLFAIILGLSVGIYFPVSLNGALSLYFAVGIFAAMDSIIGALKSILENDYDSKNFITGFLLNSILAIILAYIGDKLALPLYYAAIFVFGVRLFENFSKIRIIIFGLNTKKEKE